jgi:hypothetical protein
MFFICFLQQPQLKSAIESQLRHSNIAWILLFLAEKAALSPLVPLVTVANNMAADSVRDINDSLARAQKIEMCNKGGVDMRIIQKAQYANVTPAVAELFDAASTAFMTVE